jgi:hypothetical protein
MVISCPGGKGTRASPPANRKKQKFFGSFFQKRTACFLTFVPTYFWLIAAVSA